MTSYRLARFEEGWMVMDSEGRSHGQQKTIQEARRLLEIVRHIDLARWEEACGTRTNP